MKIFSLLLMMLIFFAAFASEIHDTETAEVGDSAPVPVPVDESATEPETVDGNTPEARRARRRKAKKEQESVSEESAEEQESPESE